MGIKEEIETQTKKYINSNYEISKSHVVPQKQHLTFGPKAKEMWARVISIDIRKSRDILAERNDLVSIKTHKAFLYAASKCIRSEGGELRSFNGDSILAFFIGPGEEIAKTTVRTGMKIKYVLDDVVNPQLKNAFGKTIDFGIGLAQGEILVAKSGVAGDNDYQDLIWIGWPVYFSVGFSETVSKPKAICISSAVWRSIKEDKKYTHSNGTPMWQKSTLKLSGSEFEVYRTSYRWTL